MGGRAWAVAFVALLLLLPASAVDPEHPFTTPGSAQDLENQREAARQRTRDLSAQEGEARNHAAGVAAALAGVRDLICTV